MIFDMNAAIQAAVELYKQNGIDFHDKVVLDMGCGDGRMTACIAQTCSPKYIYGIDSREDMESYSKEDLLKDTHGGYLLLKGDARELPFSDGMFDIVITNATFEHINGISQALQEIRRVLKPGGQFYTNFFPIWTCIVGHHCHSAGSLVRPGNIIDEKIVFGIPAWGHLYMGKEEMAEHLLQQDFDEEWITRILYFMYESDEINRRTASEIKNAVMHCGMIVQSYHEDIAFSRSWALSGVDGVSELTDEIAEKIRKTQYSLDDIGITGMKIRLSKL